MKHFIAAIVILICAVPALGAAKNEKPDTIKVLFFATGPIHNHQGLAPILKQHLEQVGPFEVTITEDLNRMTKLEKDKIDVALFYTTGMELTPEQEKGLTSFVSNGGGYAGIHSASDSFKKSDAYWKLVGGRFTNHKRRTFEVHFTVPNHEAVRGLKDFEVTDEDYNHVFHEEAKLVVLARRPKDWEPSVWVQHYGEGRVFYTGLGHDKVAWENPAFKELVTRGIYWSAKRQPKEIKSSAGCCAK